MDAVKKYLPIAAALVVGLLIGAFFFGGRAPLGSVPPPKSFSFPGSAPGGAAGEPNCATTEERMTIVGDSLAGIVQSGDSVKVLKNYYACNDPKRGDIIVYGYAGGTQPLVKVVKAIPGDRWELKKSGSGWNILVNGSPAKTSNGTPYLVGDQPYRLLSLYLKDYGGVIPGDTYLILGNEPGGSLDSTRFGLVGRSDFVGKVMK
jgi:signal peptidase I